MRIRIREEEGKKNKKECYTNSFAGLRVGKLINKIELGRILQVVIREKGREDPVWWHKYCYKPRAPGGWRRAAGKTCDTSPGTDA